MTKLWFPLTATIDIIDTAIAAARTTDGARLAVRTAEGIQLTPDHTYGGNGVGSYTAGGPWAYAEHHGHHTTSQHRNVCGITLPTPSAYIAIPDGLSAQAHASLDAGCQWTLLDLTGDQPAFTFHATNLDRPHAVPGWEPALVHLDEYEEHGYPALVATTGDAGAVLRPAFTRQVVEQIAADFAVRAAVETWADTIRITDTHVELVGTIVEDGYEETIIGETVCVITPDERGLYQLVDQDNLSWSIDTTSAARCECAQGCQCSPRCWNTLCEQPLGSAHDPRCYWTAGSAPYERPQIPAEPIVLDAHIHSAGCPQVTRHPRGLFTYWVTQDQEWDCDFCGTTGSRDTHIVYHSCGTVSHHQRCTLCQQTYTVTSATCLPDAAALDVDATLA